MRAFVVVMSLLFVTIDARAEDAPRVASAPEVPVVVEGAPAPEARASEPSADTAPPTPSEPGLGDARDDFDDLSSRRQDRVEGTSGLLGTLFKTMFMLALVVGAAYLTLHKGVGKILARAQQGQRIQVVERVPLGERRSLYLVRVDGKEMLLGVGEGGITALSPPAADGGRFAALVDAGNADRAPPRGALENGAGARSASASRVNDDAEVEGRGDARRQDG